MRNPSSARRSSTLTPHSPNRRGLTSAGYKPAVNVQNVAGDETRLHKVSNGRRYIADVSDASLYRCRGKRRRIGAFCQWRANETRRDSIDANALRSELRSQRNRESPNATLED